MLCQRLYYEINEIIFLDTAKKANINKRSERIVVSTEFLLCVLYEQLVSPQFCRSYEINRECSKQRQRYIRHRKKP